MAGICSSHSISLGLVQRALGRVVRVSTGLYMRALQIWGEIQDAAGSEEQGAVGFLLQPVLAPQMLGPGPGWPLSSDPARCRHAGIPELSTLQQKSEICIFTRNLLI